MKKIYLFSAAVLMMLLPFFSSGQYYYYPFEDAGMNPGNLNTDMEYPPGGGLPNGWATLSSGSADPSWTANQAIPFSFEFNGTPVSDYKVATTGVLTFNTAATTIPDDNNDHLPSSEIPDQSVVVWGLKILTTDFIVSKTFGEAPNRQHWVTFNSASVSSASNIWTYWSIILEETTNNIYIVDQRTGNGAVSLTLGIQIDQTTAFEVLGSPNLNTRTENLPDILDNSYWEFKPGIRPDYDLGVVSITTSPYQEIKDAPYTIEGQIRNYGKQSVTSFDLNYQVDGGAVVTQSVNTAAIDSFGFYSFQHFTPWTPDPPANYTIRVWASNINGNTDSYQENDEASISILVVEEFPAKITLHESFTSSTCGPCKPGNENVAEVLASIDDEKYLMVKYQMSWPGTGDPYYTLEAFTRRQFYGVSSVPQLWVGGDLGVNSNVYTATMFNEIHEKPALAEITATHVAWGQAVDLNVEVKAAADLPANAILYVAILENMTYENIKTNGETQFEKVMKKMLPDGEGSALGALPAGQSKSFNFLYTFPGDYRLPSSATTTSGAYNGINLSTEHSVEEFDDLSIVVWVQNPTTKEIYQSAESEQVSVGLEENKLSDVKVNIYPNPFTGSANVSLQVIESENVSMSVVNMLGASILQQSFGTLNPGTHTLNLDAKALNAGVYFVRFNVGDHHVVKKIVIND